MACGLSGALSEPDGDRGMGGVVEFTEQSTVEFERVSDQSGNREHEVPVGHRGADLIGDEGALDEGVALVARGAEAALLAGKRAEEFMAAVGAVEASEAGVEVAAVEEGGDGCGGLGRKAGHLGGVVVENLPDRRGAGLAGTVAMADQGEQNTCSRREGKVRRLPDSRARGREEGIFFPPRSEAGCRTCAVLPGLNF